MSEIQDPFFEAKEHISHKLAKACSLRDLYFETLRENGFKSSSVLINVSEDFQNAIDDIDDNLVDLEEVVSAVESRPEKYGILSDEVYKRRTFVDQVRTDIEKMKKELKDSLNINLYDKNKSLMQPILADERQRCESVQNHQMLHQYELLLRNEQDIQLTQVFGTVQNLREQASIMGRELEEQSGYIRTGTYCELRVLG